jgi:hypothetical protein
MYLSRSVRRERALAEAVSAPNVVAGAAEEVEEEDDDIVAIEKLQTQGISTSDIAALKAVGIHTANGLLMRPKRVRGKTGLGGLLISNILRFPDQELVNLKGFTDQKIEKITEAAHKLGVRSAKLLLYQPPR